MSWPTVAGYISGPDAEAVAAAAADPAGIPIRSGGLVDPNAGAVTPPPDFITTAALPQWDRPPVPAAEPEGGGPCPAC